MSEKNVSKMLFSNQEPQKIELALDSQLKDIEQKAQSVFNDGRRDALQEVLSGAGKMEAAQKKLQKTAKRSRCCVC